VIVISFFLWWQLHFRRVFWSFDRAGLLSQGLKVDNWSRDDGRLTHNSSLGQLYDSFSLFIKYIVRLTLLMLSFHSILLLIRQAYISWEINMKRQWKFELARVGQWLLYKY
jgi:hypothetical protein